MKRLLICCAAMLCIFASCQKSENNKLVGTWLLTQYADDSNSNRVMDASEIRDITPTPMMNTMYTFRSRSRMEMVSGCIGEGGNWDLKDDGKKLDIILNTSRLLSYRVISLDDKTLIIEQDGANGMLYWQTLTKQ